MPFAVPYRPARRRKMKKGFTLIELLVVVLIIGILSAVALPQYRIAVAKSRVTEQMVLFSSVMKAQQIYYMANGTYTTDLSNLDIQIPNDFVSCKMHEGTGSFVWCQIWGDAKASSTGVSLEYSLNKQVPTNNCIAVTALGDKVCKSFGGEYKETHTNGARYYSFDL